MDKEGSAVRPGSDVLPNRGDDQISAPDAQQNASSEPGSLFSFSSRRSDATEDARQANTSHAALSEAESPVRKPQTADAPEHQPDQEAKPRRGGDKQKRNNKNKNKPQQETPVPPPVKPIANPATMKRRHWGIMVSLILGVLVPLFAVMSYLFFVAQPQFHSVSGFTVRSQEESGANDILGGLSQLAGGTVASDNDILYEFIRSQEMVHIVDERIDLREHYSQHWPNDWFFSIWDDATNEDLIWYWNRVVRLSFDQGTGLIEVQTRAFDPETAQAVNQAIVEESSRRINDLNLAAREEAMQYARTDLEEALEQLKDARQALTNYRTQSQIVDPELDIQTRMGVMSSLQQELATALVEYDLLLGTTGTNDPRLRDASQRIDVIRDRIAIERKNVASSSTETGGIEEDYPTLIAEFERLTVDREYAEQFYFAALTAMETARDDANRHSRYLATYIKPTRAQTAEYPQKFVLSALTALFLFLAWSIVTLIVYSIRDRS